MKRVFVLALILTFIASGCAFADWGIHIGEEHHGFAHREGAVFEHREHRGYEYRNGAWFLGGVAAVLVAGAIIESLPPRHDIVYVGGTPYYYDGTYYYQQTPDGYVVVQPVVVEQTLQPIVVRPAPSPDFIPVRFRGVQYYVHGDVWYINDERGLVAVHDPTK